MCCFSASLMHAARAPCPEHGHALLHWQAHDSDVNVLSWNRQVAYMLASGSDDGALKIWDLRSFQTVSPFKWECFM